MSNLEIGYRAPYFMNYTGSKRTERDRIIGTYTQVEHLPVKMRILN